MSGNGSCLGTDHVWERIMSGNYVWERIMSGNGSCLGTMSGNNGIMSADFAECCLLTLLTVDFAECWLGERCLGERCLGERCLGTMFGGTMFGGTMFGGTMFGGTMSKYRDPYFRFTISKRNCYIYDSKEESLQKFKIHILYNHRGL